MSYGEDLLRQLGAFEPESGMYANLGIRVTRIGERMVELGANPTVDAHGFPGPNGPIVHGGAVATIADCALACAAVAAAEEGEACTTADLRVEFFRPTRPGGPGRSPTSGPRVSAWPRSRHASWPSRSRRSTSS